MASLALIFHIIAIVCWALAAVGIPVGRFNLVAAGLFLWFLPGIVVL